LNTFKEKEELEDKYAFPKFEQWLKKGKWGYRRFRYAKDITSIDIDKLPLSKQSKIHFKKILGRIDFDHDGIINRDSETWFFDLKYKKKKCWMTWVNQNSYQKYYELTEKTNIPFILVVYVHEEDKLYFHRVRNPNLEPKPKKHYSQKDSKHVYIMPQDEYFPITGFNVPWKPPKSVVDYHIQCLKIEELYTAWKENRKPRFHKDYASEVIEMLKQGHPQLWKFVPKAEIEYPEGVSVSDEDFLVDSLSSQWVTFPWKKLWKKLKTSQA